MGNLNLINHLYLSENSRKIGTQLIKELSINRSNNLSLFLNVNKCFDDREATLVCSLYSIHMAFTINQMQMGLFLTT